MKSNLFLYDTAILLAICVYESRLHHWQRADSAQEGSRLWPQAQSVEEYFGRRYRGTFRAKWAWRLVDAWWSPTRRRGQWPTNFEQRTSETKKRVAQGFAFGQQAWQEQIIKPMQHAVSNHHNLEFANLRCTVWTCQHGVLALSELRIKQSDGTYLDKAFLELSCSWTVWLTNEHATVRLTPVGHIHSSKHRPNLASSCR